MHMMTQSLFNFKLVNRFKTQINEGQKADKQLFILVQQVLASDTTEEAIAFVPNHLGFRCNEGILIHQRTIFPFQSYIVTYTQ
jgi:hypothetical protein